MDTRIRDNWSGKAVALEPLWTLTKRDQFANLVAYSNQFGWELRVESGDLLLTQVCRSGSEIEDVSAAWRAAFIAKGWSEHVNDTTIK